MRANAQAASAQLIDLLAPSQASLQGFRLPEPSLMELDTLLKRSIASAVGGSVEYKGDSFSGTAGCSLAVDAGCLQHALTILIEVAQFQGSAVQLASYVDAAGTEIRVQPTGPAPSRSPGFHVDAERAEWSMVAQEQVAAAGKLVESQGGRLLRRWAGAGNPPVQLIRLPIERTLAPNRARRSAQAQHSERRPMRQRLGGIHVLLVEDDPDALEFLSLILSQAGARVSPFGLAQPAYDFVVANKDKPDIAVSDIAMPGQDGYSLLQKLRAWEHAEGRASVPAIAVSAFCRDEDVRRSIAAGFDRHWTKPVEAAHIVDQIGAWIAVSR
jgi:CheY-like chemotaxis protein